MNFRLRWATKSTGCGDEFMSALLLTHQAKTSKNQEGLTLFVSNELINNCGRTQSSEGLIEHFNYYFKHVIVSTWMKFAIISAIVLRFLLPSTLVHVGRVWIFPDVQRWRDKHQLSLTKILTIFPPRSKKAMNQSPNINSDQIGFLWW